MTTQVTTEQAPHEKLLMWDWSTRVFHWGLVSLLIGAFVAIKTDHLDYHIWCGYGILTLLVFRFLWGWWGSYTARWWNLELNIGAVWEHAQSIFRPSRYRSHWGHNPLGAWAVLAMLGAICFQVFSGLSTNNDDFAFEAPWYSWVGKELSDRLTHWHHWNSNILLVLAGAHLFAIILYRVWLKDNLALPMLTGYRHLSPPPPKPAMQIAPSSRAWACWIIAILVTVAMVNAPRFF